MQIQDIINIGNTVREKSVKTAVENKNKQNDFKSILKDQLNTSEPKNSDKIDKKLMDVCVQMESLLVSKMFKTMRDALPKTNFIHGGYAEKIFKDMLYDEYSVLVSKNHKLGIASMLYRDLSK